MEYTVNKLAKLSGISTRTLRYYDEINLLKPQRISSNGYRIYGQIQVDLLQQILIYRKLNIPLETIREIITAPDFDTEKALEQHLTILKQQQLEIDALIENVEHTISAAKGEKLMSNEEKFKVFKKKLISDNEEKYGDEVIEKYGREALDASNAKVAQMTPEQWKEQEALSQSVFDLLTAAMANGEPSCKEAQEACDAHRKWLCMFWKNGTYSKEAHRNLGEMYCLDERFKSYYDNAVSDGAAEFLYEALKIYTK